MRVMCKHSQIVLVARQSSHLPATEHRLIPTRRGAESKDECTKTFNAVFGIAKKSAQQLAVELPNSCRPAGRGALGEVLPFEERDHSCGRRLARRAHLDPSVRVAEAHGAERERGSRVARAACSVQLATAAEFVAARATVTDIQS